MLYFIYLPTLWFVDMVYRNLELKKICLNNLKLLILSRYEVWRLFILDHVITLKLSSTDSSHHEIWFVACKQWSSNWYPEIELLMSLLSFAFLRFSWGPWKYMKISSLSFTRMSHNHMHITSHFVVFVACTEFPSLFRQGAPRNRYSSFPEQGVIATEDRGILLWKSITRVHLPDWKAYMWSRLRTEEYFYENLSPKCIYLTGKHICDDGV
jgi:hypothetical protein